MTPPDAITSWIAAWVDDHLSRGESEKLDLTADTSLVGESLLDSLAFLDLVAELESTHGVELDFSDADPEQFVTLGGLARLVHQATRRAA